MAETSVYSNSTKVVPKTYSNQEIPGIKATKTTHDRAKSSVPQRSTYTRRYSPSPMAKTIPITEAFLKKTRETRNVRSRANHPTHFRKPFFSSGTTHHRITRSAEPMPSNKLETSLLL